MVIYMRNPVTGATKVATMQQEAEADMELGWEIYDPCQKVEVIKEPQQAKQDKPKRQYNRKAH